MAELERRRKAVLKEMGRHAVLVLFAAQPRVFSNDIDYPYRQDNDFYYLTGINQPGGILVMSGDLRPDTVLYMVRPDPAQESWTGRELSFAAARARTGITEVRDAAAFGDVRSHVPKGDRLLLLRGSPAQYPVEMRLWRKLPASHPEIRIHDAGELFASLRAVKSPWEIELLQHAADITAEAQMRAMAMTEPGRWEYQIRAEMAAVFGVRQGDDWVGYPEIVASGGNATTLHYETDDGRIPAHGLMLVDAAAEYGHMSADVTRTFPIDGTFTPEQAAIYRLVYAAQQAAIATLKPGSPDFNPVINQTLIAGLTRLGLITTAPGAPPPLEQLRIWYFHGPSHPMGLDVHDPGGPIRVPGAVISMEPGLYFRARTFPDDVPAGHATAWKIFTRRVEPVFEQYKGIGVRIEDDVLITASGHRVLSAAIPSRLEAVEARWRALHAYVREHGGPPPLLP